MEPCGQNTPILDTGDMSEKNRCINVAAAIFKADAMTTRCAPPSDLQSGVSCVIWIVEAIHMNKKVTKSIAPPNPARKRLMRD